MISGLYSFLDGIGFSHPLHPIMTHAPMGMIIGMILFGLLALKWQGKHFALTAYYLSIVALISIFPTALLGMADWLYFFQGEWYPFIILKMTTTTILVTLLIIAIVMRNGGASRQKLFLIYLLCMACASVIGYAGGDLVYG